MPPRPLSRREREVARLAAQRTLDDAAALIKRTEVIYRESGCAVAADALAIAIEMLGKHLNSDRVVTEL